MPTIEKLQPADIKKIVESQKDYSMVQIRKSLQGRKSRFFTLEQKILILKYLQLTDMDHTKTSRDLKVSRPIMYKWIEEFGETVFEAEPEARISQKLETDLDILRQNAIILSYQTINATLSKFNELIEKATTPRQIHSVTEAMLATVEFIKTEKEKVPEKPVVNDFYMEIHNLMMNNIKPSNGN